jgi:hypothetical protein
MYVLLSLALFAGAMFGSEWLVDSWLGEDWRLWVGLAGIALLLLAGALVKASGITELTRLLRQAVLGAGIGAALNRTGLRLGWLRSGLRLIGIETEPDTRTQAGLSAARFGGRLLTAGWAGSLVGLGLTWTGMFGG